MATAKFHLVTGNHFLDPVRRCVALAYLASLRKLDVAEHYGFAGFGLRKVTEPPKTIVRP